MGGTLWAAYNGVCEWTDHCGSQALGPRAAANGRELAVHGTQAGAFRLPPAERRLESCWFGTGYRTKVRAWDAAVAIARARGLMIA